MQDAFCLLKERDVTGACHVRFTTHIVHVLDRTVVALLCRTIGHVLDRIIGCLLAVGPGRSGRTAGRDV